MSITIRKFNQFPTAAKFWPDATWYDAELNELAEADAKNLFMAGGELYCSIKQYEQGDLFRVVFAPQTGETPAISLAAIDFRGLELLARSRQLRRQFRAVRF